MLKAETKIYPSYVFNMIRRNGLVKNIFQKDITYYSKYREFSGMCTINDHISDNSVHINIKFTFTMYEYIIVYEYIQFSFLYIDTGFTWSFSLLQTACLILQLIQVINK